MLSKDRFVLSGYKYLPFSFHLISVDGQHPLFKKCMFSLARGIAFLSPVDTNHSIKYVPEPLLGSQSCKTSTAKELA